MLGHYERYSSVAQLHCHCLVVPYDFSLFPTALQLTLPSGWAAHMAAISHFLTALHSLFISIHLCLIPCMSEIFLKSRIIPVVQIFPLTSYPTELFPLLW